MRIALLGLCAIALWSCQCPQESSSQQDSLIPALTSSSMPETREEFVDLLQPLPATAVRVIYEVEGPAGLTGQLEVVVHRGGLRREEWVVSVSIPGAEPVQVGGRTIRTLDRVWSVSDGRDAVLTRSYLGSLASAYLELPLDQREQVAEVLRRWHRDRRVGTNDDGASRIAGESCSALNMATQSICLWHEAGLPLLYRSEGFVLRAIAVDRDPSVDPSAFQLPAGAKDAPLTLPSDPFSPEQALRTLGQGDVAAVLLSLQSVSGLAVETVDGPLLPASLP